MAYVTPTDFQTYSPSASAGMTSQDFAELAERASEVLDWFTMGKIEAAGGLTAFSAAVQAKIKKAVCAEVQTLIHYGGVDVVTGSGDEAQSVSVGKFSYSLKSGGGGVEFFNGIPFAPLIKVYLQGTGLLYRGIDTVDGGY